MSTSTFTRSATRDGCRARRRLTDRLRPLRVHRCSGSKVTLRLGYLTRITHASALVGIDRGLFAKNLGPSATLAAQPLRAGHRGGHRAVVRPDSTPPTSAPTRHSMPGRNQRGYRHQDHLRVGPGRHLIRRQTRDQVRPGSARQDRRRSGLWAATMISCLRSWLQDNGLHTNTQGGGDVFIKPTKPESAIVQEFGRRSNRRRCRVRALRRTDGQSRRDKAMAGSREPSPMLVVRQDFLAAHPDSSLRAVTWAGRSRRADPRQPRRGESKSANNTLAKNLGKGLDADVLDCSRSRRRPSPTTPTSRR